MARSLGGEADRAAGLGGAAASEPWAADVAGALALGHAGVTETCDDLVRLAENGPAATVPTATERARRLLDGSAGDVAELPVVGATVRGFTGRGNTDGARRRRHS